MTAALRPGLAHLGYLLLAPALTTVGLIAAPHCSVSEAIAAAVTFGGASTVAVLPLALATRVHAPPGTLGILAVLSLSALGAAALASTASAFLAIPVNLGLVTLSFVVGGSIGRRIAHPGHLFPASVVAACFDVASVVHEAGPSHAIARNAKALSVLALSFPVPSTHVTAPSLGLGDLVFVALLFAAARTHRLSLVRTTLAVLVGLVLAAVLSATFGAAVPALVPIGASMIAIVPGARSLRREDRRVAGIAIAIALAAALGTLLSQFIPRAR